MHQGRWDPTLMQEELVTCYFFPELGPGTQRIIQYRD